MNYYESQISANILKPENSTFILLFINFEELKGTPPKHKIKEASSDS